MSRYLNIWMTGVHGEHYDLAGANAGAQGVELRPKASRMIDAPAQTFWIKSANRSHYQQVKFQRRDPVFSVNIFSLTGDPDDWHDVDSKFRMALGMYDKEFTLHYETKDGIRSLPMRLLEEPKAYEVGDYEGKDPHLYAEATLAISAAAAQPFWTMDTLVDSCTFASGSGTQYVTVQNLGDVPIWLRWKVPAPSQVTLPDWSWGQENAYGSTDDSARTWPMPTLLAGEHADVNSDHDVPLLIAANGAPIMYRAKGSLLYPVAPHTEPTPVPVTMVGGTPGATVYVEIDRWFSRPFGVTI